MHDARVHLGAAYDLLEIDADFGLEALQQAFAIRNETRPSLTSFAALILFHRATELIDGLSVLLKAGCVVPMTPLVRCLLESVMYARYLMTVNDERVAACYIASQQLADVANFEEQADKHAPGSAPTLVAREARRMVESALAEERIFREARRELATLNKSSSVPVPWYQAFGGPRTLGGLSKRLDDEDLERVFVLHYDRWSAAAHASDAIGSLAPADSGIGEGAEVLNPLRSPTRREITGIVRVCHDLFLMLIAHHIKYFQKAPTGLEIFDVLEERLSTCLAE